MLFNPSDHGVLFQHFLCKYEMYLSGKVESLKWPLQTHGYTHLPLRKAWDNLSPLLAVEGLAL